MVFALRAMVLAIEGIVTSGVAIPVAVTTPGRTLPERSWILLAPPAEQPNASVAVQVIVAVTESPFDSDVEIARFGPTLSSKSVAPLIDVMVSGNCRPGVEPSLLDAAGGVVDVTLTVRPVCAGFQEQLTFVPQTQLPVPLVAPGSLSVVWIWMVVTS